MGRLNPENEREYQREPRGPAKPWQYADDEAEENPEAEVEKMGPAEQRGQRADENVYGSVLSSAVKKTAGTWTAPADCLAIWNCKNTLQVHVEALLDPSL